MLSVSQRNVNRVSGVTLVELLVVMTIASVLLALVFPSIRAGMGTLELRSSAQRLAAASKYARDQAIYRQRPYELEIDTDAKTVSILDSNGGSRSFDLPADIRVTEILPSQDDATSRILRFAFSPDGSTVPFQIALENPRRRIEISADPLTGFPKVSDIQAANRRAN
jgi:general secretion pathway protein H